MQYKLLFCLDELHYEGSLDTVLHVIIIIMNGFTPW